MHTQYAKTQYSCYKLAGIASNKLENVLISKISKFNNSKKSYIKKRSCFCKCWSHFFCYSSKFKTLQIYYTFFSVTCRFLRNR